MQASSKGRSVNLPLTDYYANKFSGGNEVTVYNEGDNQYMVQAQKQMQQRHVDLQRSLHMRYQYGGNLNDTHFGGPSNSFVK